MLLNLALWISGIVLIAVGYNRARGPWQRYQALKAQDANIARYEAWRGGLRDNETTGASVAMQILRRQAQIGARHRRRGDRADRGRLRRSLIARGSLAGRCLTRLERAAGARSRCSDPSRHRGRPRPRSARPPS